MADLTVIVPSRERVAQCRALIEAFRSTCTASTRLVFSVDDTDPQVHEYTDLPFGDHDFPVGVILGANTTMVEALNRAAAEVDSFAVGFLGDDHRPRSHGWDKSYLEALRELGTGIVYGNDLLQGENLPTQCAMTTDIVRAVGWMAPPELVHLAVDNWWLDLGRTAGCIRYLPDVVVEHMHPVAGKADWDAGHLRVNAPEMYERDLGTYQQVKVRELPRAVIAVRALRAGT